MVKQVYNFDEFKVLDWYPAQKRDYLSIEEVACYLQGLDWYECINRIRKPDPNDKPLTLRMLKNAMEIKERELREYATTYAGVLVQYSRDSMIVSPFIFYTKESIKEFLLLCYPDERPIFLYPDAVPAPSKEEVDKEELRQLRANVKQLQKLVIGLAMHQHNYNPITQEVKGGKGISEVLAEAEKEFNDSQAKKVDHISITMSAETAKKYLRLAYEGVKKDSKPK